VITTSTPTGHSSMGISSGDSYIRVTSPLRRYSDLFMHWQIKSFLLPGHSPYRGSQPFAFSKQDVDRGIWRHDKVSAGGRLSKTVDKFWLYYFLKRKLEAPEAEKDPVALELLGALTAIPIAPPVHDRKRYVDDIKCLIPQLGVIAHLISKDPKRPPAISSEVPVQVSRIRLGEVPRLEVTIKQ